MILKFIFIQMALLVELQWSLGPFQPSLNKFTTIIVNKTVILYTQYADRLNCIPISVIAVSKFESVSFSVTFWTCFSSFSCISVFFISILVSVNWYKNHFQIYFSLIPFFAIMFDNKIYNFNMLPLIKTIMY